MNNRFNNDKDDKNVLIIVVNLHFSEHYFNNDVCFFSQVLKII